MKAGKKRIWVRGQNVEVTDEVYMAYTQGDRKMRYFENDLKTERFVLGKEGQVVRVIPSREDSLDRLMDENAQQFPHEESVENTVLHKLEVDKLHTALAMLTPEEQALIQALFFEEKTERQYAEELGVYRNAIHVRKTRILKKLKNFWNDVVQTSHPTAKRVRGFFMTSHRTLKTAYPFIKHIPASLAKAKARTAAAR